MRYMIRYSHLFEGPSSTVMFFTGMQQRVDIVQHQVFFWVGCAKQWNANLLLGIT
jgi:hypothetical protein